MRIGVPIRRALLASAAGITTLFVAAPLALAASDTTQFAVTAGTLSFATAPDVPNLPGLTLNGQAQTLNTTMNNYSVADASGTGNGWNLTVVGDSSANKSPVFKQYCPNATCGSDSGPGYIAGGPTLPANSLTLTSTGASFSAQNGSTGTAPTLQCSSACNVDSASAVKIASAASNAGMGTWLTTGFSATSLALSTPSTLKLLSNGEVYRVNLLWTLAIALEWVTPYLARISGFTIAPAHFVERHGLVVLIAIGESVVAIGSGELGQAIDVQLAGVAVLEKPTPHPSA